MLINLSTFARCVLFVLGLSILGAGTAVSEEVTLPPEVLGRLREMVTAELENSGGSALGDSTVERVSVFAGNAITPTVLVPYHLFPALEMFSICSYRKAALEGWLYMSCGKVTPSNAVRVDVDGTCSLNESLRDRVLSCASGILYEDITMANLSCQQLPDFYLYSQKVQRFVSGASVVQILLDSKHEPVAIRSSNHWQDAPKVEERNPAQKEVGPNK